MLSREELLPRARAIIETAMDDARLGLRTDDEHVEDIMALLDEAAVLSGWTAVSEWCPEPDVRVLGVTRWNLACRVVEVCHWARGQWWAATSPVCPTHIMPLPAPPTEA